MSHGKTHHHLGDSGASHSHHTGHSSRVELSVSHIHTPSSTFHALHHEATASLSSRPSLHLSSVHIDKSLTKPAVKAADSVHIASSKPEKSTVAGKTDALIQPPLFKADKTHSNSLDLGAMPKLSIVNESRGLNSQRAVTDLSSLVPPHLSLSDRSPVVQRTAATSDANNLFAPAPQVLDMKPKGSDSQTPAVQFDKAKALSDMTNAGAIVDRTAAGDQSEKAKLQPGEVPNIKVTTSVDQQSKPDFLIKKDGTVEMFNNPQVTGQKDIVVQFEKDGDQFALTDAQKAAGGDFYTYLQAQLKSQFPQATTDAIKVDDSQGLLRDTKLPPEVKKNLEDKNTQAPKVSPESGLPEKSGPTMQDTNRIRNGGNSSDVPRSAIDNMTPPAKRIPNEADRMAAMKDTVASYVTRGEQKPYDYASKRGDRGWGVGRYGMTYGQVGNWLEGLSDEQIAELIKQGKLSPAQGANLKKMRDSIKHSKETGNDNDLHPFLKAMKNGEGTAEDMKKGLQEFLPDKVQELAASDQISKISNSLAADAMKRGESGSVDPGQVALSFVLGRNIDKKDIESNPEYKQFAESARQAYRLQEQARMQNGDVVHVENMSQVSQALNNMVGQQFWREAAGATEYGNKGCAIAVTRALQGMGVQIGAHLDVTGTMQEMRQRRWQEVSIADAMRSGKLFVAINKETGSHTGLGLGNQVWENSSGQRQFVTRNMSQSTLRYSGRAFIVPIEGGNKPDNSAG